MTSLYNSDYYTLSSIPKYRLDFINLRLNRFIEHMQLKITDWPLDCKKLYDEIKLRKLFNLEYAFVHDLSPKDDGIVLYLPEFDLHLIHINGDKCQYPYQCSSDRRLNFTFAHELAHILLDHDLIPRELKTDDEIELEENEADEMAGRLLMPKILLFSINYHSAAEVAEYFMVSKTALWKRLNNLKRLDLLRSRNIHCCKHCGNMYFSPFSEYCGICGNPLEFNLKGIRRISYPKDIEVDEFKRVKICPVCRSIHFNGDKCRRCGTYIFNFCSDYLQNGEEGCSYANPGNSRYCEMCGKPTYFYKKGLLNSWDSVLMEEKV